MANSRIWPKCIITPHTIETSILQLEFSHQPYASLYSAYLRDTAKEEDEVKNEYDDEKTVKMHFAINWTHEDNDFVFDNEVAAAHWETMVGLCSSISSTRKRIMKQVESTTFKEKLGVSDEPWSRAWRAAVEAPVVQQTPQNQLPLVTQPGDEVPLPRGRIKRTFYRFGARLGIRVIMPKIPRKKKKAQNMGNPDT